MSGFAVLHREAREHPLFVGDVARFGAWSWLILTACWKPTPYDLSGTIITLERGQLCTSRSQLAKAWGWSPSAVERFLTRLQTEQMIERETGQGRSVITICNYEKYQDVKERPGQAAGQGTGQPADSQRTAKEQDNQLPLSNDNGAADFWKFATAYLGNGRRSVIGRWCKQYGGQVPVAHAITEAQLKNVVEPVAYIEAVLRKGSTKASAGEIW